MFSNYSFIFFIASIIMIAQESVGLAFFLASGLAIIEIYYQWRMARLCNLNKD